MEELSEDPLPEELLLAADAELLDELSDDSLPEELLDPDPELLDESEDSLPLPCEELDEEESEELSPDPLDDDDESEEELEESGQNALLLEDDVMAAPWNQARRMTPAARGADLTVDGYEVKRTQGVSAGQSTPVSAVGWSLLHELAADVCRSLCLGTGRRQSNFTKSPYGRNNAKASLEIDASRCSRCWSRIA